MQFMQNKKNIKDRFTFQIPRKKTAPEIFFSGVLVCFVNRAPAVGDKQCVSKMSNS